MNNKLQLIIVHNYINLSFVKRIQSVTVGVDVKDRQFNWTQKTVSDKNRIISEIVYEVVTTTTTTAKSVGLSDNNDKKKRVI